METETKLTFVQIIMSILVVLVFGIIFTPIGGAIAAIMILIVLPNIEGGPPKI